MLTKLVFLLLFVCANAFAQTKVPAPQALPILSLTAPGSASMLVTKNGQCLWWYVDLGKFTPAHPNGFQLVVYCGTSPQMAIAGAFVETIRGSTDPLKTLQTMPQWKQMSAIHCPGLTCTADDPALAAIVADLNAVRNPTP